MTTELQPTIDASIVEAVLLHGNLAKLTPAQRVSYYRHWPRHFYVTTVMASGMTK